VRELKVEVLGTRGKWIIAKIGRQRKPRELIAFKDDKGNIIVQGDDCILQINPETREAVYNLKGGYLPYLRTVLGAKVAKVPQEFIDTLKKIVYREGELIGVLPKELGSSPVIFGGCKTI